MNVRIVLKWLLTAATLIAVVALMLQIPLSRWLDWGQQAAFLSVGLSQPEDSVRLIGEQIRGETAGTVLTTTATTTPTVSLGGASLQTAVTTAVPTGVSEIPAGGGVVLTQQISAGKSFVQGVAIKNNYGQTVDIAAALAHTPALSFSQTETAPQVLIVHTHTTECYLERDDGVYSPDDATRTTDATKNMVAVGQALAAQLKMAGIGVIHDTAIHDQPYNGAYSHSKASVEAYLKQYPTIRVVLDLHRDAIYPNDTTRIKPTTVIDGKKAAQVMIIVGMLNSKTAPNTHVQENLSFGARLQQQLHTDYPGLMRPLNLANARYNQQLTNGSLLIEMGSDANTLEEAVYAAELVGKGLVQVLRSL